MKNMPAIFKDHFFKTILITLSLSLLIPMAASADQKTKTTIKITLTGNTNSNINLSLCVGGNDYRRKNVCVQQGQTSAPYDITADSLYAVFFVTAGHINHKLGNSLLVQRDPTCQPYITSSGTYSMGIIALNKPGAYSFSTAIKSASIDTTNGMLKSVTLGNCSLKEPQ